MALLELQNLQKHFGKTQVLRDLSLQVEEGQFVTLLGPSGCGKTTTLRIVAGLTDPDGGDVLLEGRSMLRLPPEKRELNTVFQNYALFPHMNVEKNVAYALRLMGMSARQREARVAMKSACRTSSPGVSASASPLPGRWLPVGSCFCWTSPWARWT